MANILPMVHDAIALCHALLLTEYLSIGVLNCSLMRQDGLAALTSTGHIYRWRCGCAIRRSHALKEMRACESNSQARRYTSRPGRTLSLVGWRPAKSSAERLPVELTLHRIHRASVVESEHFIIQIQAIRYRCESFRQFVGSLQVDLQVRVEVLISIRPL
jgi:hypothetical protein